MAMAHGHEKDPDRVAAWLSETMRLLRDLPRDILAGAIDDAIKASARGFMPAVGEIRAFADPRHATRHQQTARLERTLALIDGPARLEPCRPLPVPAGARDDRVDPADVAKVNRAMRRFGCSTRYRDDGSAFTLPPGEADPTANYANEGGTDDRRTTD